MGLVDEIHAAAKIIRADGTDGFQSATRIVGQDMALAMLIVHLRESHNIGRFPDAEDTTERVNDLLKRERVSTLVP